MSWWEEMQDWASKRESRVSAYRSTSVSSYSGGTSQNDGDSPIALARLSNRRSDGIFARLSGARLSRANPPSLSPQGRRRAKRGPCSLP